MISFETVLDQFPHRRVMVIGDIMLDRFVYGTVSRISPEAPAPVIWTAGPVEAVGGSGNVARNLVALGAACDVLAVIGRDEAGDAILRELGKIAIPSDGLVQVAGRVTTLKTRFVADLHNTHLLRADTEETTAIGAGIADEIIVRARRRLDHVDAVILSDYAKGVLTPGVIAAVIAAARAAGKPVIVDPKGGDHARYRGATALTPNVVELAQLTGRTVCHRSSRDRGGCQDPDRER